MHFLESILGTSGTSLKISLNYKGFLTFADVSGSKTALMMESTLYGVQLIMKTRINEESILKLLFLRLSTKVAGVLPWNTIELSCLLRRLKLPLLAFKILKWCIIVTISSKKKLIHIHTP